MLQHMGREQASCAAGAVVVPVTAGLPGNTLALLENQEAFEFILKTSINRRPRAKPKFFVVLHPQLHLVEGHHGRVL